MSIQFKLYFLDKKAHFALHLCIFLNLLQGQSFVLYVYLFYLAGSPFLQRVPEDRHGEKVVSFCGIN